MRKALLVFSILMLLQALSLSCKSKDKTPAAPAAPAAPTATDTAIPCGWPSDTCTFTPTSTPTDTVTGTPTDTFTITPTPTESPTPTLTETPYCGSFLLFGYETGTVTSYFPNRLLMTRYEMQVPGVVMSLAARISINGANTMLRLALYSDNAGVPGTLLAESHPVTTTSNGWNTLDIPDQNLPAGHYWIAAMIAGTADYIQATNAGGTSREIVHAFTPFPETFVGNASSYLFHLRAKYCPLAPTFTPTLSNTPTETLTPTDTYTPTDTFTATLSPTETLSPTPTNTLTPNPTCATTHGTFGNTTGAALVTGSNSTMIFASKYALPVAGTIYRLSFYVSDHTGYAKAAIYMDSGSNTPGILLVESSGSVEITSDGWYSLDVPRWALAAQSVWLTVMLRPTTFGNMCPFMNQVDPGLTYIMNPGDTWDPFPAIFSGYSSPYDSVIYAHYCTP